MSEIFMLGKRTPTHHAGVHSMQGCTQCRSALTLQELIPVADAPHPQPGGGFAVGHVTHGSDH